MKKAEIFCDGACSGNPGPGGYGCIIRYNETEKEISGGAGATTNNRMEMTAAIVGLEALKKTRRINLTTDSQYLVKGMTEWIKGWQKRGWINASNKPVLNRDLWERLLELSKHHDIKWIWVRGHAGHSENTRCDDLARAAIESFKLNKT